MSLKLVLKLYNHSQEWIFAIMTIPVCMDILILAAINGDLLIFNDPKAGNRWNNQSSLQEIDRIPLLARTSPKCEYEQTKGRGEQYFPKQSESQKKSSILYVVRDNGKQQIPFRCSQFMQQLKTMIDDVRQQESAEIHNSKLAFKEELDNTAESKKNASLSTQPIIPYPKTIEEYIVWLKKLLSNEIKNLIRPIQSYIASLELKQKEKQIKCQMNCLNQYIAILQQPYLEHNLPSKLYQSTLSELMALVMLEINDLIYRLNAQEQQNYERIAKFNKNMLLRYDSTVKYQSQLFSIKGMINFNLLALFLWKNYRYRQKYGIQCLIPQRIANTLFDLTNAEFNRFEERFLATKDHIYFKFTEKFDTVFDFFCLIELKHKLAYMKRSKYQYKRPCEVQQQGLCEFKTSPVTLFQFCQIALFPLYSKKESDKKNSKVKEKITREMQAIANIKSKQLMKTQLLRIKNQHHLSLQSTLEFFDKVCQNPERKILLTHHQMNVLYKQFEYIKWIYFTRNTTQCNQSKDLQFYISKQKLNVQLSPSAIVTFKIAMQRYKLMERVNTSLLKVLRLAKRPIIFISRHVFSFSNIKGILIQDQQSLITNPASQKDIFYTHILAIRKNCMRFSALYDQKISDNLYCDFLLDFCAKRMQLNNEVVVLHQFEHNRQVNWEAFTRVLRGFKSKMSSDIIIVNNLKMFIIHHFANVSVEWLLRSRSQDLTTDNFGQMIKTTQAYIFNIIFKEKQAIQRLLDEAISEDQINQAYFLQKISRLLQILTENQDNKVFLQDLKKYQHGDHNVQYSMQAVPTIDQNKDNISYYEAISLQKKSELGDYLYQQFKEKYNYLGDYDKEVESTNFTLLLEKYSMTSTDVRSILSKCSKFILIGEVIIKEIERQFNASSKSKAEAKQFSQEMELLSSIFEHQKENIQSISPGERSKFLRKVLCMSKYPATKLAFKQ